MTREEPAFKIKTGNLPVLLLHILTTDLSLLEQQLTQRLAMSPDFFASTPIVLELSAIAHSDDAIDFAELASYMREHRMCAAGVAGGSERQRACAVEAGLGLFADQPARSAPQPKVAEPAPAPVSPVQQELPGLTEQPAKPSPFRPALVVDKPVRTGQRIYAEGSDLVVLAIVNAGAELIADGDIHVYAPMRGKAIAGAKGNEGARIFVQGMEAELLSIAGCFKVFEDEIAENVRAKPARVHLEGSRLVIEPLNC